MACLTPLCYQARRLANGGGAAREVCRCCLRLVDRAADDSNEDAEAHRQVVDPEEPGGPLGLEGTPGVAGPQSKSSARDGDGPCGTRRSGPGAA